MTDTSQSGGDRIGVPEFACRASLSRLLRRDQGCERRGFTGGETCGRPRAVIDTSLLSLSQVSCRLQLSLLLPPAETPRGTEDVGVCVCVNRLWPRGGGAIPVWTRMTDRLYETAPD